MAQARISWFRTALGPYRDNASATRDFRSQLRGGKAILLWGFYLLLLIAINMLFYKSTVDTGIQDVAFVQGRLRTFYQSSLVLLAVMISVVTPALTAGTIAVERQRRSLDLLFSAPITLKSLLVGKMISSFRYSCMLLVLSLPVTSVAVVMGGASWSDVLAAYLMLASIALVFTAIGLLVSSITQNMGAAIIFTYLAVFSYVLITAAISSSGMFSARSEEAPWYIGLNPFFATFIAPTYTNISGYHIPNWIFIFLSCLAISKILLLGAGSSLSPFKSKETRNLRGFSLLYLALFSGLMGWAVSTLPVGMGVNPGPVMSRAIVFSFMSLLVFFPHIISYGTDSGFKYKDNGRFSLQHAFDGSRAGSLPYLMMLCVAMFVGFCGGFALQLSRSVFTPTPAFSSSLASSFSLFPFAEVLGAFAWVIGFIFMMWAVGRLLSSRAKSLKAARTMFIGSIIAIFGLPLPILTLIYSTYHIGGAYYDADPIWMLQLLYPYTFSKDGDLGIVYALIMVVLGVAALALEKYAPTPVLHESLT